MFVITLGSPNLILKPLELRGHPVQGLGGPNGSLPSGVHLLEKCCSFFLCNAQNAIIQ